MRDTEEAGGLPGAILAAFLAIASHIGSIYFFRHKGNGLPGGYTGGYALVVAFCAASWMLLGSFMSGLVIVMMCSFMQIIGIRAGLVSAMFLSYSVYPAAILLIGKIGAPPLCKLAFVGWMTAASSVASYRISSNTGKRHG